MAKFKVIKVEPSPTHQNITMSAVTSKPFDKDGNSEDNTFSRWTPTGELTMTITNPNLFEALKEGQKFYLTFTEAAE